MHALPPATITVSGRPAERSESAITTSPADVSTGPPSAATTRGA
jgi:hypothetical protein